MTDTIAPGIYKATVRGVPDQTLAVFADRNSLHRTFSRAGGGTYHRDNEVADLRPVVILDLAEFARDKGQTNYPHRFAGWLRSLAHDVLTPGDAPRDDLVHWIADQIRAQSPTGPQPVFPRKPEREEGWYLVDLGEAARAYWWDGEAFHYGPDSKLTVSFEEKPVSITAMAVVP